MATDAIAYDRLKEFKFRVEINGLPAALVKEFNPGARTHGVTEHAGAGMNHSVKEAAMIRFENATLRMVVPLEGPGRSYFEEWLNQAEDPMTGNGGRPASYQRQFSMYELDPAGNPIRVWEFIKAFPVHYNLGNRNSLSDNADAIEEIAIAYTSRSMRVL